MSFLLNCSLTLKVEQKEEPKPIVEEKPKKEVRIDDTAVKPSKCNK